MQSKKNTLSVTVGITTCYGDSSIIETVKSIRNSKNVSHFDFILVSDRVPISNAIKKELKKYDVTLIENKHESSQIKKQKQILKMTKTDIIILTQDDVLLDNSALAKVLQQFTMHPNVTMISIRNRPLPSETFFEEIISVGTNLANKFAKYWNNGDNYLSVIGRFMAFRTDIIKKKMRMPDEVATSDAFYYFENKRVGGIYEYIDTVSVLFRNPQNIKEHIRKSSRFQYSKREMSHYFKKIDTEYNVPKPVLIKGLFMQFLENPILFILYVFLFTYTRFAKSNPSSVLNPIWEVDLSTKQIK